MDQAHAQGWLEIYHPGISGRRGELLFCACLPVHVSLKPEYVVYEWAS